MTGYLLDTNCISELVRLSPDRRVTEWLEATDERLLHISVLTLGEIRKGLATLSRGKRRSLLETWLDLDLRSRFEGRVLSVDAPVADRWGVLAAEAKSKGVTLPVIDGLIAATAAYHNLTVATRNVNDFVMTQVAVLNPWEA
jgi:predicted nucleic acid-binding protein